MPDIKKKLSEKQLEVLKNMSLGHIGKSLSEEHKRKISIAHKGKIIGAEQREKLRVVNLGKKYSEITRNKHRIAAIGIIQSEKTRKKHSETNKGYKNHFWKGGISPLRELIRKTFESRKWAKKVFERDNYTCQECSNRGGRLHSHHIKEFNILFQEFLYQYNQFSPIEDKETLLRLAINYQPFWNLNNGITYCKECHKKTKNYGWSNYWLNKK